MQFSRTAEGICTGRLLHLHLQGPGLCDFPHSKPFPSCYVNHLDILAILNAQGIEPHPGPGTPIVLNDLLKTTDDDLDAANPPSDKLVIMEVLQVSNFASHIQQVTARPADVLVVGEHSMDEASAASMVAQLQKTYNISSIFSGVDAELKHLTGGVGSLARSPHRIFFCQCQHPSLSGPRGLGQAPNVLP